jgi:RHS repeat-associated protein
MGMSYSGNQLSYINSQNSYYSYDANGNTTHDGLRNFPLSYNLLNLPHSIASPASSVYYGYLADGQKRQKTFSSPNDSYTQHYRGSMVYKGDGSPDYALHPEGLARYLGNGQWQWLYSLTDHLGSVRAVVNDQGAIVQQTDYYPFGQAYSLNNTDKNKYLYGGKELQDEVLDGTPLNLYDSQARMLDTRDGRFMSIDPLAEKYYSISPYAYCANNPTLFVDPNGMDLYISFSGAEAKLLFMQIVNQIFAKQFEATLKETEKGSGMFEVGIKALKGGSKDKLAKGAQSFYEGLNGVIESSKTVSLAAVYGSKNVNTGSFETGQIDMANIDQFPEYDPQRKEQEGPTKQGKLMHEVREQFKKASGEKSYDKAHGGLGGGVYWENHVNGNVRKPEDGTTQTFYRDLSNGKRTNLKEISKWELTLTPIIKVKRTK